MRRVIVAGVALGVLFGAVHAAAGPQADRRSPPRLSLRADGEVVQQARPFVYCWSYSNGDGTSTGMCADGFRRYPKAAQVESGARMVLRIHHPGKPDEWFLNAYRATVRHKYYDEPVGDPEEIPFKLRAHRRNGKVTAWDLVFRLDEPMRHYYLDTGGYFEQGDAFYALHAQTG
jgi:hypothetical protein